MARGYLFLRGRVNLALAAYRNGTLFFQETNVPWGRDITTSYLLAEMCAENRMWAHLRVHLILIRRC